MEATPSRSSTVWCWSSLSLSPEEDGGVGPLPPTWPSSWRRTRWWCAQESANPCRRSLSLSSPNVPSSPRPVPFPRSHPGITPRVPPRGRGGPPPESAAGMRAPPRGAGSTALPFFPLSPRQSLDPLPATRAAGKSGPACWRCGDPGHFIDRCPVMEVGALIRVPDDPQAAPDQAGLYQIP
ncbi:uncharacterized protein [Sinocyclocheilus grahami]|uniref:uncharacterized protein isoform X1 n=1 Tax=Sinocyclocheilus grahami TaxID=75366 RepID=UPI0007ACD59D|nr:PREDICTED: uncharacterized protein LOC107559736 isoform X1 [Sinocyclocheilus grahami]